MKNILITGATGMIGGLVLRECLERNDVQRVTTIGRKRSGRTHPKLVEVLLDDLADTASVAARMEEQDICFFCLGTYTGALPAAEFRKVMTDVPVAFAKALKQASPGVCFCFLSGDGADRSEKSRFMFARDRGAAERLINGLGFERFHAFRPGYIYPVEPRREPNGMYRTMRILWKPLLSWLTPGMGLTSHQLAHAMVKVGFGAPAPEVIENREIKRIAGKIGERV